VGSKCAPKTSVNSVRSVREKTPPPSLAIVLFLTEENRWAEHTNFHRDIKSTDFTERYSQH